MNFKLPSERQRRRRGWGRALYAQHKRIIEFPIRIKEYLGKQLLSSMDLELYIECVLSYRNPVPQS